MTPALSRIYFGHPSLVEAQIGRNVMLVFPPAKAVPDAADYVVS